MQAWQQVQVTNDQSGFVGAAGLVLRVEGEGDKRIVYVKLDGQDDVQTFDATELRVL